MKMRLHSISSGFVLALILASAAGASYAGDKTLTTSAHGGLDGGVFFTLGDSTYSGALQYNDTYTVNYDTHVLREGKEVVLARLYVYWVWSQRENTGVYPTIEVSVPDDVPVATYTDTKGFVGRYDYFSGVTVYNCYVSLTTANQLGNSYSVTVKNVDANGSTFCVQGIGLLVVYKCCGEGHDCSRIEYWINEGCDMIYAEYGITPEMATSKIYFDGVLDLNEVERAYLITAAPSGGYVAGGETAHHTLYLNEESGWLNKLPFLKQVLRLLFGYGGGVWSDVYIANDSAQIGVDQRDVTEYLKATNNFAAIQDNHDYMMVTNAVLVVEKKERDNDR